ncbi:MAG TPA: NCS1 family nucleobase:cation symporter-1 [Solirubrobacteraceae bacterium]
MAVAVAPPRSLNGSYVPAGASPRLYNDDLAPTKERTWGTYSLFAMWMSDVHSIGGYTFAAGLFFLGLAAWQVGIAMMVGILVVYGLMLLTGRAGQQTGVPFPVLARLSFGVSGANLPALIRACIGIAWYGIQTYLASVALQVLLLGIWPGLSSLTESKILGLSQFGWICFLTLSVVQALVMRRGMETVRRFQDYAGPVVYVAMFLLAGWILVKSHFNISLNLSHTPLTTGNWILQFATVAALVVAYFSALLLNYCDFSRFAPGEKTVRRGTMLGLPVNFAVFSFITVLVTAGSVAVFGSALRDPVEIVARIHSTAVVIVGAIVFTVATVGINLVANYVSPAYDLANVAPDHIDFRRGGLITSVLAVVVLPWQIYSSAVAVNYFLGGLGAVLGPLFAIMMVDYYRVRRGAVDVDDLYRNGPGGAYWYKNGWNPNAVMSFLPAAAVSVPVALVSSLHDAAAFSWFIGAGIAGLIYAVISRRTPAYSSQAAGAVGEPTPAAA